jgi:hypothetical protein
MKVKQIIYWLCSACFKVRINDVYCENCGIISPHPLPTEKEI